MKNFLILLTMGFAVLVGGLVLPGDAAAQTRKPSGATLTGVVIGADDKPVANASVMCESSGGLKPRAVRTDAKGRFKVTGLKQDSYDLKASWNGAYSDWERNIPLRRDQTKDVTLRLLNGNTALTGTAAAQKSE